MRTEFGLMVLCVLVLFATPAASQTPPVPLGPIGTSSGGGNSGTVTSVGFTGGLISVGTPTTTPALTVAGTSGGIPYFNSTSTWASSAALAANSLVIGGGAGAAPSTVTTDATALTALGVTPIGSGKIVLQTSPTLTTPALGVATGMSLALSANGTAPTAALSLGGVAGTGIYAGASPTTQLCFADVNGTCEADFGILNASSITITPTLLTSAQIFAVGKINAEAGVAVSAAQTISFDGGDAFLSGPATATLHIGGADSTTAIPQFLGVQGIANGNTNTNGADWTFTGSVSTGTGTAGNIIIKTGSTGTTGSTKNPLATALTLFATTQRAVTGATIGTAGYTVATLPTTGFAVGDRAYVTDQLTTCAVAGAVLTGGGAVKCPVFYNGSAWVGD